MNERTNTINPNQRERALPKARELPEESRVGLVRTWHWHFVLALEERREEVANL